MSAEAASVTEACTLYTSSWRESRTPSRVRLAGSWVTITALVCALVLSGCSSPPPSPQLLTDLQISHVRKIPGIEALEQRVGIHDLLTMTTSRSSVEPHATHVLFNLLGGGMYDVLLDGGALQQVPTRCAFPDAVTPDGIWLACQHDNGIALHDLRAHSEQGDQQVLSNSDALRFGTPTWTPDGHHLAMVLVQAGGCTVAVYAADPTFTTFTPSALLEFPEFTTHGPSGPICEVSTLSWSADGHWLSLLGGEGYNVYAIAVPAALQELLHTVAAPATPLTFTFPQQSLLPIGPTYHASAPVWSPVADTLTLSDGQSILNVNVVTRVRQVVLTQHTAGIFSLSWTPEGRQLVFVLALPHEESRPPPAQLYVYTPPS
jgi:hypothetical protein